MEVEKVKRPKPSTNMSTSIQSLMLAPLTSHTHPLMKIMIKELEEEGLEGINLVSLGSRHWNVMVISTRKISR